VNEPLHFSFDVECPPEHAFATWTERIASWRPPERLGGDADTWRTRNEQAWSTLFPHSKEAVKQ
jgi:hypothetical protein